MFDLFKKKAPAFDVAKGGAFIPPGLALVPAGSGAAPGSLYASLPAAGCVHYLDGLG